VNTNKRGDIVIDDENLENDNLDTVIVEEKERATRVIRYRLTCL
jgi:hypothetical protein